MSVQVWEGDGLKRPNGPNRSVLCNQQISQLDWQELLYCHGDDIVNECFPNPVFSHLDGKGNQWFRFHHPLGQLEGYL